MSEELKYIVENFEVVAARESHRLAASPEWVWHKVPETLPPVGYESSDVVWVALTDGSVKKAILTAWSGRWFGGPPYQPPFAPISRQDVIAWAEIAAPTHPGKLFVDGKEPV